MVLSVLSLALFISCKESGMKSLQSGHDRLDAISPHRWEILAQKKIFFGHKSVGQNIVAGLEEVMARRPLIKLDILETSDPADLVKPVFAHALIGTNKDPVSKIVRFSQIMDSGVGRSVDIAFFKLCFVDIDHSTDVEALLNSYAHSLARLEAEFPDVRFITVTVPLISRPVGIKARLKKLLGRLPWDEADNVKRNVYNGMLREKFKGSLFDLAAIESRIDGERKATFTKGGKDFELLHRPYTSDGGHLNSTGRQIVAIELLIFLAALEE